MLDVLDLVGTQTTRLTHTPYTRPAQAVVVIVSDSPAIVSPIEAVCDFLDLAVEHVTSAQDVLAVLDTNRPMALITEMDGRVQDGFNVMMAVAEYNPELPLMVLTGEDPTLAGAADAIEELWHLTHVIKAARMPKIGELVDFFFTAGRKTGCMRLMPT
jgi:DNA-binding NtrC family response regulator